MTAEPLDYGAIGELYWPVSRRPPYGFEADFGCTGWSDTPCHNAFIVGGDYKAPTGQQSRPRSHLDGGSAWDVIEWVVDLPPKTRLWLIGRRRTVRVKVLVGTVVGVLMAG